MENRRLKFGYDDIYKKIEVDIFGIVFEINKEKIMDKDIKNINENDEDAVKNEIEEIIGKGAVEKINSKVISDGYAPMTLVEEFAVLTCLYKTYITFTAGGMIDDIINTNKEMEDRVKNINNNSDVNREERRSYDRYRGNRRIYRRY